MALKSSFKCNYKPYWLLKERKENIPPSVAGAGGSDAVDGARKAFGIFTSAPGHSFKQCATRFSSPGQPWARLDDAGFPVPSAAGSTLCPAALARVGCGLRKAGSVRGWQTPRSTEPKGAWSLLDAASVLGRASPPVPIGSPWGAAMLPTGAGRAGASPLLSTRASKLSYDSFRKWINNSPNSPFPVTGQMTGAYLNFLEV